MKIKPLDVIWLALLAGTGCTWALAESGALASGRWALTALVFVIAWLKGLGVLLEFMELRHAPPLWRRALVIGLSVLIGLILLAAALAG